MEGNKTIDEYIINLLNNLQDNYSKDDQQWVKTLIEQGANNISPELKELGTLMHTTIMDTVLAKLLGINPNVLARAAVMEDYICEIWGHNNLDKDALYKPILEESQRIAIYESLKPLFTNTRATKIQNSSTLNLNNQFQKSK